MMRELLQCNRWHESLTASGAYTSTWFNMWRVIDGDLTEHWDPAIKAPLTFESGNNNAAVSVGAGCPAVRCS
jgi:predicted SnoaL-like aldol condensation-catalyzing enzyme